jgi:hypothetical protein
MYFYQRFLALRRYRMLADGEWCGNECTYPEIYGDCNMLHFRNKQICKVYIKSVIYNNRKGNSKESTVLTHKITHKTFCNISYIFSLLILSSPS